MLPYILLPTLAALIVGVKAEAFSENVFIAPFSQSSANTEAEFTYRPNRTFLQDLGARSVCIGVQQYPGYAIPSLRMGRHFSWTVENGAGGPGTGKMPEATQCRRDNLYKDLVRCKRSARSSQVAANFPPLQGYSFTHDTTASNGLPRTFRMKIVSQENVYPRLDLAYVFAMPITNTTTEAAANGDTYCSNSLAPRKSVSPVTPYYSTMSFAFAIDPAVFNSENVTAFESAAKSWLSARSDLPLSEISLAEVVFPCRVADDVDAQLVENGFTPVHMEVNLRYANASQKNLTEELLYSGLSSTGVEITAPIGIQYLGVIQSVNNHGCKKNWPFFTGTIIGVVLVSAAIAAWIIHYTVQKRRKKLHQQKVIAVQAPTNVRIVEETPV